MTKIICTSQCTHGTLPFSTAYFYITTRPQSRPWTVSRPA